ncbi:response regulator transcription factor [Paenibacillus silagei]|uniref:DNA-binding CsgD family transcriptional regulator n=1 Tax=Paenibacillus silagei TaxID=1670801 RepID=A0ABS4NK42_9BACL|nr:helix-turn-helix transcriptional regulator [Paenibacillus silagei]MBP2110423.1 DNA-binding CsgD family transcriptional regulator [Paenibacillus silagei]
MEELKESFVTNVEDMSWIRRTSDCYFIIDETGRVIQWSTELEMLLGISATQAVGKTCRSLDLFSDCTGNSLCKTCQVLSATKHMDNCNGSRKVFVQCGSIRVPFMKDIRVSNYDKRLIWVTLEQTSMFSLTEKLTPQENKVLDLLSRGHSTQQISLELYISYTTVRTHIRNLLSKLGVHNQKEAVSLFFRAAYRGNNE